MLDKSRFKNYGLWISVAALIPLIFKCFGVNIIEGEYEEIVQSVLSILVMMGIINNPTTITKGFGDDKEVLAVPVDTEIPQDSNDSSNKF